MLITLKMCNYIYIYHIDYIFDYHMWTNEFYEFQIIMGKIHQKLYQFKRLICYMPKI